MTLLINRELSWLSFNERVLQEAMDKTVPLVERIRFLGIYSNNLDEFFRVRVANLRRMQVIGDAKIDGFSGTPDELLEEIRTEVLKQQKSFEWAYRKILVDFARHNVFHITHKQLSKVQKKELTNFYEDKLRHAIVPIILDETTPFPRLKDHGIYLAVKMKYLDKSKIRYALVQIPYEFSRFHEIREGESRKIIMMDDIIRMNLRSIFSIFKYKKIEAYTFKFTRDAELNLDDDISLSFFDKIEKSVKLRKKGEPLRFVYDQRMPEDLLHYLLQGLKLKVGVNTIPGGKYHNFKDFRSFPDFGNPDFVYPPMPPLKAKEFENQRSIFKAVLEKDILLHFPYQRFTYVVDLLREAAIDPKVTEIKINVYRVAEKSQILNALRTAVSNGKKVVIMFELQARFDEENNLLWADRLREEGALVLFGNPNRKVHSKLLQIRRMREDEEQVVSYIGTGNFHEGTATVYGDLALLTANKEIAEEVDNVFEFIQGKKPKKFKHLIVSPMNTRSRILELIENEISFAKAGKKSFIKIKLNNLVDEKIIAKLYEASNAGVKIKMMIRGICCLVPKVEGFSKNISVLSLVDRYLEHARFFIFSNDGDPLYYISSADWMERNFDNRIEVTCPILHENLKREMDLIFDYQSNGNVKVRYLNKDLTNRYRRTNAEVPFRAQFELYKYYKEKVE
jgi:polyphosphate kinase